MYAYYPVLYPTTSHCGAKRNSVSKFLDKKNKIQVTLKCISDARRRVLMVYPIHILDMRDISSCAFLLVSPILSKKNYRRNINKQKLMYVFVCRFNIKFTVLVTEVVTNLPSGCTFFF